MMQSQETRDYMQVATPIQAQPATPVVALENAMKQLNGCRSDADIQALSSSVEKIMLELSGVSHESGDVLKAMKASELALKNAGQTVKSSRIGKMRKLFAKLPKQSPKKQRKMLREILALTKKNLGMKVAKRGFCGTSLSCNAAVVTGSVLVLAGATAMITMAAMGQFDGHDNVIDDANNDAEAVDDTPEDIEENDVADKNNSLDRQVREEIKNNKLNENDENVEKIFVGEEEMEIKYDNEKKKYGGKLWNNLLFNKVFKKPAKGSDLMAEWSNRKYFLLDMRYMGVMQALENKFDDLTADVDVSELKGKAKKMRLNPVKDAILNWFNNNKGEAQQRSHLFSAATWLDIYKDIETELTAGSPGAPPSQDAGELSPPTLVQDVDPTTSTQDVDTTTSAQDVDTTTSAQTNGPPPAGARFEGLLLAPLPAAPATETELEKIDHHSDFVNMELTGLRSHTVFGADNGFEDYLQSTYGENTNSVEFTFETYLETLAERANQESLKDEKGQNKTIALQLLYAMLKQINSETQFEHNKNAERLLNTLKSTSLDADGYKLALDHVITYFYQAATEYVEEAGATQTSEEITIRQNALAYTYPFTFTYKDTSKLNDGLDRAFIALADLTTDPTKVERVDQIEHILEARMQTAEELVKQFDVNWLEKNGERVTAVDGFNDLGFVTEPKIQLTKGMVSKEVLDLLSGDDGPEWWKNMADDVLSPILGEPAEGLGFVAEESNDGEHIILSGDYKAALQFLTDKGVKKQHYEILSPKILGMDLTVKTDATLADLSEEEFVALTAKVAEDDSYKIVGLKDYDLTDLHDAIAKCYIENIRSDANLEKEAESALFALELEANQFFFDDAAAYNGNVESSVADKSTERLEFENDTIERLLGYVLGGDTTEEDIEEILDYGRRDAQGYFGNEIDTNSLIGEYFYNLEFINKRNT